MKRFQMILVAVVVLVTGMFFASISVAGGSWFEVEAVGNSQFSIVTVTKDDNGYSVLRVINHPDSGAGAPKWEARLGYYFYAREIQVYDQDVVITFTEGYRMGVMFFNTTAHLN